MSTNRAAPRLGILMGDAPSHNMVVVLYQSETTMKWAYVASGHNRMLSYDLVWPEDFTPLASFGVHATMTHDGFLAIHQLCPFSTAKYPDGKQRNWQGSAAAKIQIIPRVAGHVVDAIRKDFEARKVAAVTAAP